MTNAECRLKKDGPFPSIVAKLEIRCMGTTVRLVEDFELDGTGNASAWDAAEWLKLPPIKGIGTYATGAKIAYSSLGIYCLFDCVDQVLTCTDLKDNDHLYNQDVVEAFFWPEESQHLYLEYELSPLGRQLPLMVPNHGGQFMGWIPWNVGDDRQTRRATAIRGGEKLPGAAVSGWSAEFFIPFALMRGLRNVPPNPGTIWRANFYRIDYDQNEQTLFAWATGVRNSFHDFREFGTLRFA